MWQNEIFLLHDFHINALGQIGEFSGCVSGADGFAEGVEDLASGLAVLGDPKIRDDFSGSIFVYRYRDFEGDLLASVNEGLPYGERIA